MPLQILPLDYDFPLRMAELFLSQVALHKQRWMSWKDTGLCVYLMSVNQEKLQRSQ